MASKWLKLSLHRLRRPKTTPPPTTSRALEFKEAFRRFDSDGDGKISEDELTAFLSWAGDRVSGEEVERVMREHDSDGDRLLDYEDFLKMMEDGSNNRDQEEEEEDLKRAFEMFETEKGSGRITPGGLRRVLVRLLGEERTEEECAAMIRVYDVDGDGVMDYQEFQRMMMMMRV